MRQRTKRGGTVVAVFGVTQARLTKKDELILGKMNVIIVLIGL